MKIPINKDIEVEYKDQFLKGFSIKEVCYVVVSAAIIIGMAVVMYINFGMSLEISIYVGIPFGLPVLLAGFKKFQGLTLIEYIKELRFEYLTKELYYDADELPKHHPIYDMEMKKEKQRK